MRRGALFNLLVRPLTIWYVPFAVAPLVMALLLDPTFAGGLIRTSLFTCAILGLFLGGQIRLVIGCSFAWTLPRFRRAVVWEFVVCGVAVSAVPGLIVAIATGAISFALMASVTGLAAFSVSGALCVIPEAAPLVTLGSLALLWFPVSVPAAILDAPVAVITVGVAISSLALWLGFRSRTVRWSAVCARQGPVGSVSYQLHSLLWGENRLPHRADAPREIAPREVYVGTSVLRGVASTYQAARRRWLQVPVVIGILLITMITADVIWLNLTTDSPAAPLNLWLGLAIVGPITVQAARRSSSRVALPWSRRQHLAVSYTRDLIDTLAYVLAVCLPAITVFFVIAHPDGQLLGTLARAAAATALFFPVFQWPDGPTAGKREMFQRQSMSAALFVGPVVTVTGVALCVYGLPRIFTSLAAQVVVLGLLLIASQGLYWLRLRRHFTTHDLVDQCR